MLKVDPYFTIPDTEFELSYARSSGPGGQNVNKVNSKAVLKWAVMESPSLPDEVKQRFLKRFASRLTGEQILVIASDRFRDQARNVSDCLEKLAAMLRDVAVPPKKRKATKPTRGSVEKRIQAKKGRSERKAMRRVDY